MNTSETIGKITLATRRIGPLKGNRLVTRVEKELGRLGGSVG